MFDSSRRSRPPRCWMIWSAGQRGGEMCGCVATFAVLTAVGGEERLRTRQSSTGSNGVRALRFVPATSRDTGAGVIVRSGRAGPAQMW
jgi:hypothetical protein